MTAEAVTTVCPVCGRDVPDDEFCGTCGTHLSSGSSERHHAFAAHPGEHVFHLGVLSTMFPHLPHHRMAPFRIALLGSTFLLVFLGTLRLTAPSIAIASMSVPLLYIIYLYEVEIYEDEPVKVVGATFVLGLLFGIPWALVAGPTITRTLLQDATQIPHTSTILLVGVLFPILRLGLMLAGALIIYRIRKFDEALDGFTFGVASALGFILSATLIELFPQLKAGEVASVPVLQNTLAMLQRGLLVPFSSASVTGLIAAALWLRRGNVRVLQAHGWTTSIVAAVILAMLSQVGLGILDIFVLRVEISFACYAGVSILLLFCVRAALHHMLLAEAVKVETGPSGPCSHCHRVVPRMAFCPHCGIATRATPKSGIGSVGRVSR